MSCTEIVKSGLIYNRSNQSFDSKISFTNTSSSIIYGPIVATIAISDPKNVTLKNSNGISSSGFPIVNVSPTATLLNPGQSTNNIPLSFNNPKQVTFTYNVSLNAALPDDIYESLFPTYINARQGQLNGLNNVNIGIIGDSLSVGQFAYSNSAGLPWSYGGSQTASLASLLANRLEGNDDNTWGGAQCGDLSIYEMIAYDTRITQSAGGSWGTYNLGVKIIAGGFDYFAGGVGAGLTFTPNSAWDTVDIYWLQNQGYGSLSISANGISTSISSHGALGLATTTLTKANGHSPFTMTPTGENHIVGLNFYSRLRPNINFLQLGCGGTTSGQWVNNSSNWTSLPALEKIMATNQVHLWLIQLGANDQIQFGLDGLNNYQANMQTLINTLKKTNTNPIGGDVVLMVTPPIKPFAHASLATNIQYRATIYTLAKMNNLFVIDNYDYFSSFDIANALGWYSVSNNIHQSTLGYEEVINNIINTGILD